jgi:hypothetical protein
VSKRQQPGPNPPFFATGKKYPALLPELRPYGLKRKTVLTSGLRILLPKSRYCFKESLQIRSCFYGGNSI